MNMAEATSSSDLQEGCAPPADNRRVIGALLALIALQMLVYGSTYFSMAEIWWRSETFSHGFLIFPIAVFLVWRNRAELARLPLRSDLRALLALFGLALGWAVARSVDVLVVEQFAAVLMLPVLVWLCLGPRGVWALAFPLAFILLAVPVGEFLIYPMMEFTAAFTVNAVRLTGIPVYWDGMFFTLPSGTWNIVEGCSGVRYIIASVTLGVLYAYLTYHSYWRRAAFIVAACLVPVIANGMRAFIIVMLGHFSGMKIATGVDHLIYGWVWFGIVMFFLFWLGGYWRDEEPAIAGTPLAEVATAPVKARPWYVATVPAMLLLVLGPFLLGWQDARTTANPFRLQPLAPARGWAAIDSFTEWKPSYVNPASELQMSFASGEKKVGIYLAYYSASREGSELINSQNVMIHQKHPVWRQPTQVVRRANVGDADFDVFETTLKSDRQNLLVWHWSRIGGRDVNNPYQAKIFEALTLLSGAEVRGFALVVYTPFDAEPDPARARLQEFLDTMLPTVDQSLGAE